MRNSHFFESSVMQERLGLPQSSRSIAFCANERPLAMDMKAFKPGAAPIVQNLTLSNAIRPISDDR